MSAYHGKAKVWAFVSYQYQWICLTDSWRRSLQQTLPLISVSIIDAHGPILNIAPVELVQNSIFAVNIFF